VPDSLFRFASLGAALAERGLGVQLPLTAAAFDEAARAAAQPRLRALWTEARGALLVGSAGPVFFERFRAAGATSSADPLDAFTRDEVESCCTGVLGPGAFALRFPFVNDGAPLPFQALARAAGAPASGPLGLIVLKEVGPWWAFRALILLPFEVPAAPPRQDLCAGCAAPCVRACPGDAVHVDGFWAESCGTSRRHNPACADQCLARRACPVGASHAYAPEQIAFHMKAVMRLFPERAPSPAPSLDGEQRRF